MTFTNNTKHTSPMEHNDDYAAEGCCVTDEYDDEAMLLAAVDGEPELLLLDAYLTELFRDQRG